MTHAPSTPAEAAPFDPGQLVATPGALDALDATGEHASQFLARHLRTDWGDLDAPDQQATDHALATEGRLLSAYTLRDGTRLWRITEADRSRTCLLLPSEY